MVRVLNVGTKLRPKEGEEARCSLCGKEAVAYVAYQRRHYCRDHFIEFVERKVRSALRRYGLVKEGEKVLIALSGGKDSAVLATIMKKLSKDLGFRLAGVHIDLGIGDFSKESLRAVEDLVKRLDMPLIVVSLEELLGASLTQLARRARRPPCSVCGLVKRYLLNVVAVLSGADRLALGHNADDIAAYALKAFITGDLESISKLGPKTESIRGLAVGRVRPLYEVYEDETRIYAELAEVPVSRLRCPHLRPDQIEFSLKRVINGLERERPGMKLSFVRSLARNIDKLPSSAEPVVPCRHCGMLSSTGTCSFCRLTQRVFGRPMGKEVKERIADLLEKAKLWS